MPRRPSAIAAVMSRSDSSMARSLSEAPRCGGGPPSGEAWPPPLNPQVGTAVPAPTTHALRPAPRRCGPRTGRDASGRSPMRGMRAKAAVVLVAAAVLGYAGAAAYSALAGPSVAVATDFGPDDGLTRYVLTAASGTATPELLGALEHVPGVASAQRLASRSALAAWPRPSAGRADSPSSPPTASPPPTSPPFAASRRCSRRPRSH